MHEHSNYQLLNVKTGKEQPFSTMRQAIDAADKHKPAAGHFHRTFFVSQTH